MKNLILENKTTELFTTIYPNENRETVILLHGGPGVPDSLESVAELIKEKFQVISFHQRGTGLSACSSRDYSMEAYMSDIDSIAAHFNLRQFHLFGHSWGGLYAQIYAGHNPSKILSMFLCSPGSGTGIQWKRTQAEVLKFNKSKCSSGEFLKMGLHSLLGMFGSNIAYQKLFRQVIKNYNKGFTVPEKSTIDFQNIKAEAINSTLKELLKYPLLPVNADPSYKITVTYGDADIYGDSKKYVRERYPSASFHVIENSGHLPWLHNFDAFKRVLLLHFP